MSISRLTKVDGLTLIVPGKVHHVVAVAVADGWEHEHRLGRPLSGGEADRRRELHVHVEGKVVPVLLDRADREHDHLLLSHRLVHLGPREVLVAVLPAHGLAVDALGHGYQSPTLPSA